MSDAMFAMTPDKTPIQNFFYLMQTPVKTILMPARAMDDAHLTTAFYIFDVTKENPVEITFEFYSEHPFFQSSKCSINYGKHPSIFMPFDNILCCLNIKSITHVAGMSCPQEGHQKCILKSGTFCRPFSSKMTQPLP